MATTSHHQHSTARRHRVSHRPRLFLRPPLRMWAPGITFWDRSVHWAAVDRVRWDRPDPGDPHPLHLPVQVQVRLGERPFVKAITISPRPFREPNVNTIITSYHRPSLRRKPDTSANIHKVWAATTPTLILKGRSGTSFYLFLFSFYLSLSFFLSFHSQTFTRIRHHTHFQIFSRENLHLDDLQFKRSLFYVFLTLLRT